MRYLVLFVACIYAYGVVAKEDDDISTLLRNSADESNGEDLLESHKSKRDTRSEMYEALLDDLVKALKDEGFARQTRFADLSNDGLDIHKEVINKRKAFWQSMGGPLPVETRLASFGSRIEPDRNGGGNGPQRFKAMRYGRRR